jgi:antagonist of KipI
VTHARDSIAVRQPGVQTTVQDLGRPAWQHVGVPVGGAMDRVAHRVANMLVGNAPDAAALECALGGVALQFEAPALVALTGRDITASLDGRPLPAWRPCLVPRGALLVLHTGCRTTLAVGGGIDVPVVLDGRGTSLRAAFGGWQGRALRRDDRVPIGPRTTLGERIAASLDAEGRQAAAWSARGSLLPPYSDQPTVRYIPGPELTLLADSSRAAWQAENFRISPESDRMGFRLTGHTLSMTSTREMLSSGVTAGTVQLPPGGAPIVLMADRQTTGGYPRLGEVISVDLPLVAQLRPGDRVRFVTTTLSLAHAAYRQREHELARAAHAIAFRYGGGPHAAR